MDKYDTVSSARQRDSKLEKLEHLLGLDKLFKKKPEPEPVPEPERMTFPAPSFLRPTKIRMLARDDISIAGPGRRTRSLPEAPTTSAQVSSGLGSVSGSNEPQMSSGRPTYPTYSPFPRVPQRSTSLAPIRRGSSLAGMLQAYRFGDNRASFAGPRNSPMPSPRTRSRSGSVSQPRPYTASATSGRQLIDQLEASVCPLQKGPPALNTSAPPPLADGLLTPPLSAQQDNFVAATQLPHDKHLSLAPLSILTPETSPCLIPQPESALDEPTVQTISPQSRRGSESELATHEAAHETTHEATHETIHDPKDSPKVTSSTPAPKDLKKAALKESIGSLFSLLQRENGNYHDLQAVLDLDLASGSSASSKGKGKAVLEDLISPSENESEDHTSLSDNESVNIIPHEFQGEIPFAATSKAAEQKGKAVSLPKDEIDNTIPDDLEEDEPTIVYADPDDLEEDEPTIILSPGEIAMYKAVIKSLDLDSESLMDPGDGESDDEIPHTHEGTEDAPGHVIPQVAFVSADTREECIGKAPRALVEPSLSEFFALNSGDLFEDEELAEDDDSTKALPPSPVRSFILPVCPRRCQLPGASERRVFVPPSRVSPPSIEVAWEAARLARRFGFDVVYVVNLWPESEAISSMDKWVSKKASSSSLATLATVIHHPPPPALPKLLPKPKPQARAAAPKGAGYRLTGRLLAAHGLQHVAVPFSVSEAANKHVLGKDGWLEYRSPDPSNLDLFARGYMRSFYTGHSPEGGWRPAVPSTEGDPAIRRGIVFAAYRLAREDGHVMEMYAGELDAVYKDARNLVDMAINSATTFRQRR